MDIVAQLMDEIDEKRAELRKLESALEVIQSLGKSRGGGGKKAESRQPLFTVRKAASALPPTKIEPITKRPGRRVKDVNWRETVQNVILAAARPMRAGEVIDLLLANGAEGDVQRRVYGSLNYLHTRGEIYRSEGGYYSSHRPDRGGSGESPRADEGESPASAEAA